MDILKKSIIIVSILVIIIISVLIVLYVRSQNQGTDYTNNSEFEQDVSHMELKSEFEEVENRNNYYAVKNIIGKYGYAIIDGGQESIYNMLDPEYISQENISQDNVLEYVDVLDKEDLTEYQVNNLEISVNIDQMYYKDLNTNTSSYYINGIFEYNVNSKQIEFRLLANVDSNNSTFYIYPTTYVEEKYPSVESLSMYQNEIDSIPKNSYNTFSFVNIEDATIIRDYLYNYKDKIVKDISASYDMIEEEYKNIKFPTLEEYEAYINKNKQELLSISFSKYLVNKKSEYTEYICIDTKGNYYIFKETAIMDYKILLDNYTVNTEEFMEEYDGSNDEEKVALNIEKIVQAMNVHDYKYIFDKLDETFRNNNWGSEEAFEQYMRENFPLHYEVEYTTYSNEGSTYVQQINLTDITGETEGTISLNIIMQLKDNYEFVMSFSVQE